MCKQQVIVSTHYGCTSTTTTNAGRERDEENNIHIICTSITPHVQPSFVPFHDDCVLSSASSRHEPGSIGCMCILRICAYLYRSPMNACRESPPRKCDFSLPRGNHPHKYVPGIKHPDIRNTLLPGTGMIGFATLPRETHPNTQYTYFTT